MSDFRCRSGARCVAATPEGAALVHRDTLCYRCLADTQAKLDQLPTILEVLPLFKSRLGGESGEAKVSASKDAPAPLNVGVVDLELSIRGILAAIQGVRVVDLVNHVNGLYWCTEIRKAYATADRYIKFTRHWSRRHAKCPSCGLRCLGNFSGEDSIHCSSCGTALTRDEYSKLCLITD